MEDKGFLVTEIVKPNDEAVLMLKNLSHFYTIADELKEDFDIEVEKLSYQFPEKKHLKQDFNFIELILDLIQSSELYPEKTVFESLTQEQQEELLTTDSSYLVPFESTCLMLNQY